MVSLLCQVSYWPNSSICTRYLWPYNIWDHYVLEITVTVFTGQSSWPHLDNVAYMLMVEKGSVGKNNLVLKWSAGVYKAQLCDWLENSFDTLWVHLHLSLQWWYHCISSYYSGENYIFCCMEILWHYICTAKETCRRGKCNCITMSG